MTIIISKKEYKRRENIRGKKNYQEKLKSQGKFTEKEKISQRRKKILDLLAEGLKQKDICIFLNISKPTYVRD
ncbi:helix-turn-helix domain-containing protein, partial [Clostridium perfringens]